MVSSSDILRFNFLIEIFFSRYNYNHMEVVYPDIHFIYTMNDNTWKFYENEAGKPECCPHSKLARYRVQNKFHLTEKPCCFAFLWNQTPFPGAWKPWNKCHGSECFFHPISFLYFFSEQRHFVVGITIALVEAPGTILQGKMTHCRACTNHVFWFKKM